MSAGTAPKARRVTPGAGSIRQGYPILIEFGEQLHDSRNMASDCTLRQYAAWAESQQIEIALNSFTVELSDLGHARTSQGSPQCSR